MKRRLLPVLSALLLILTGVCRADDPGLVVAIAIPHGEDQPGFLQWSAADRGAHFHVVLTNTSNETKRIFQEWCSWGFYALQFEITDENGKTWVARKGVHAWTRNFPAHWTLPAQECLVIDVYFADRSTWGEGFWLTPGHPTGRVTLKALYQVNPDEFSAKYGVWTGKIASRPVECIIK